MNRTSKKRAALWRAAAMLGIAGGACLARPVETWKPQLTTIFTIVKSRTAVDKLDLLFMIDNSASMGDKQALLAAAVPDMIHRLVSPNCIDAMGNTVSGSTNGLCAVGKIEFPPVHDMHLGIVTSSLGGRGSNDQCLAEETTTLPSTLNAHNDDRGHLINRMLSGPVQSRGTTELSVPNAGPPTANFLAWFPLVAANRDSPGPPANHPAETVVGDKATPGTLIGDFTSMIQGVQEHGCGFEAQNEAWYRFLVQPDPFDAISIDGHDNASLVGLDRVILQQRKNFLRPDSLLAVIVVTDENEEVSNPMSVGARGWLFEQRIWPGSPTSSLGAPVGAPEGTIECQSNPLDPKCTSCASDTVAPPHGLSPADYHARCPPDLPQSVDGYLDPGDDEVNVRFFHQKQRFGVFAGYPVERYVRGLANSMVPDRDHEVDASGNYVGENDASANCLNPIFAASLPDGTDMTPAELCNLQRGPRTADLVYYAAIAGVPHQLLQAQPGVRAGSDDQPECPAGTTPADCPQKSNLTDEDWLKITGKDPENYDFTGADFHMLESEQPRGQSACPPTASDACDAINGREWNTNKADLQFACTFPLASPKDCMLPQYQGACDCNADATGQFNVESRPLCQKTGGSYTATQLFGKAYPSVREMVIAHAMASLPSGVNGIVSSICPIHTMENGAADPVFGYRPAINAIINRLKTTLEGQCLPQKLIPKADGSVPCLLLVTLPIPNGTEDECDKRGHGLKRPDANVLRLFQAGQHSTWLKSCDGLGSCPGQDPSTLPTCQMNELTYQDNKAAFASNSMGDCSGSTTPGWCYVEGAAAGNCPQRLLFTQGEPPPGAKVTLQCFEQANGVDDGS